MNRKQAWELQDKLGVNVQTDGQAFVQEVLDSADMDQLNEVANKLDSLLEDKDKQINDMKADARSVWNMLQHYEPDHIEKVRNFIDKYFKLGEE